MTSRTAIDGLRVIDLTPIGDGRGSLTTIYRADPSPPLPQWNLVRTGPNALRGCHVHTHYDEYYVPISGPMFFGFADVRADSPTYLARFALQWDGRDQVVYVPRGVLHGVYCEAPSVLAYGLTALYTGEGEFGCRWDAADLRIDWPATAPVLSERDSGAGSLAELVAAFTEAWGGR